MLPIVAKTPEDIAAMFLSESTPFVLKSIRVNCYRIISSFYVNCIMDGELVKTDDATQAMSIGNLPLQDFVIF